MENMFYLITGLWIYTGVKYWALFLLRKSRYGAVLHGQIETQLAAFWAITVTYVLFGLFVVWPAI